LERATNNQAELLAVIKALREIPTDSEVTIVTDSQHVVNGINGGLERWEAEGRVFPLGGYGPQLRNRNLWQRLFVQLGRLACRARFVPGHSGDPLNECCDSLAHRAAFEMLHADAGLKILQECPEAMDWSRF
jgi:ribonuclease HI